MKIRLKLDKLIQKANPEEEFWGWDSRDTPGIEKVNNLSIDDDTNELVIDYDYSAETSRDVGLIIIPVDYDGDDFDNYSYYASNSEVYPLEFEFNDIEYGAVIVSD